MLFRYILHGSSLKHLLWNCNRRFRRNSLPFPLLKMMGFLKSDTKTFRPLPPLPDLEISEDFVLGAADVTRVWINRASSVAHDIAVGRNLKLFVQVSLDALNYLGNLMSIMILEEKEFTKLVFRLLSSCGLYRTLVVSSTSLPWSTLVSFFMAFRGMTAQKPFRG